VAKATSRFVSRLAWRTIWFGIYAALAGILLFFALTRTEVGRDRVRRQIQSTFDARFAGSLSIGTLQGTLLNEFIATDVTLRDESGAVVATIDSVHTEPYWSDLLTASVSVASIMVVEPHLRLHRDADGQWNLQNALARQRESVRQSPLDLALEHLSIQDGRITTTRAGPAPSAVRDRWLFDYTRSEIRGLRAAGTVTWNPNTRLIDLESISFQLPEQDLALRSSRLHLARNPSQWVMPEFSLQLGTSRLEAEATLQPSRDTPGPGIVDLQIEESRLNTDELRRLVPRLPLRDVLTVEGRLGGSLDRFVVNRLTVAHNRSSVTMEGTAFGLPDSLDVEAKLQRSEINPGDIRDVWPHRALARLDTLGPTQVTGTVQGTIDWDPEQRTALNLASTFSATNREGAVRGSLDVERSVSTALTYSGSLEADSLNLAPVTGRSPLTSRLSGRLTIDGSGETINAHQANLKLSLSPSRISARPIESMELQATVAGRTVEGGATIRQPNGGTLELNGDVDATGSTPLYDLALSADALDLAGLAPRLPSTQLNARLTTQGRGFTWPALRATAVLEVDSSQVNRPDESVPLPPHDATLAIAESTAEAPRVQLTGTIASLTVAGSGVGPPLLTAGRLWAGSIRESVRRELRSSADSTAPAAYALRNDSLRAQIRRSMPDSMSSDPLELRADLQLHRIDILRRWWPDAPRRADDLRANVDGVMGADTLDLSGGVTASRFEIGTRRVDSLQASFALSGPYEENLLNAMRTDLSIRADTLRRDGRALVAPSTSLTIDRRRGRLRAEADGLGRTGPFRVRSDVALKEGHAQFRIDDLYVGAGQHTWLSTSPGTIAVYPDAVRFDSLRIDSPRPLTDQTQRIQLHGTVSAAPSDTLYAEMEDVLLYPLAQLASVSKPLGGEVNGQVAVTGGWSQPQISSAVSVRRLSFDRRVLGNLRVESRIASQTPDLFVNASLEPSTATLDSLVGPTLVPQGPRTIEENRLELEGRVQLPGGSEPATTETQQLDLTATVERADLFFFKYIFDETLAQAEGYTSGTIHVGGRFRDPIFDASLQIDDAYFTLPQFGLAYRATGPVDVDEQGIHLRNLAVRDKNGSADVRGSVLFNDYEYFSFDLSAELDELKIIDVEDGEELPFYGKIRASGPASLTGPLPNATLRSQFARTTPESELFIPVSEGEVNTGTGYIIFADSTGQMPDLKEYTRRENILSDRPVGETSFIEGLNIDINVLAPDESTVNLVFDPVVGDVVTAVGSGRVQLQRREGDFFVYGNFNVTGGTYLFTAGEVFVRRFNIRSGTLTWDGPPTNAQLDLNAEYRTRASPAGLPGYDGDEGRIPVRVLLDIGGRVETPQVDLSLARVRNERDELVGSQTLDAILNQPARQTEYATSVLLTNTFLLTTESFTQGQSTGPDGSSSGSLTTAGGQLAFNSVSQLVASQLNRYLEAALPNVDLNLGFQGGQRGDELNDLDVIYGVALRLLNERLVIRGEGVYTGNDPQQRQAPGPQGEFVVEVRLSNRISVEAFYRRSGDELTRGETITSSRGAGLSYQAEFPTWKALFARIFGWLVPSDDTPPPDTDSEPQPVARDPQDTPDDSTSGDRTSNPNN